MDITHGPDLGQLQPNVRGLLTQTISLVNSDSASEKLLSPQEPWGRAPQKKKKNWIIWWERSNEERAINASPVVSCDNDWHRFTNWSWSRMLSAYPEGKCVCVCGWEGKRLDLWNGWWSDGTCGDSPLCLSIFVTKTLNLFVLTFMSHVLSKSRELVPVLTIYQHSSVFHFILISSIVFFPL